MSVLCRTMPCSLFPMSFRVFLFFPEYVFPAAINVKDMGVNFGKRPVDMATPKAMALTPPATVQRYVVWMGGRNQEVGKWQQIREALAEFPCTLYNNNFEGGGFALAKCDNVVDAWNLFDWAVNCGIYTGRKGGPCQAWFVVFSIYWLMSLCFPNVHSHPRCCLPIGATRRAQRHPTSWHHGGGAFCSRRTSWCGHGASCHGCRLDRWRWRSWRCCCGGPCWCRCSDIGDRCGSFHYQCG